MAVSKELLKKIRQLDPGKNKYHNKNTSCLSKHVHQSKAEANYCNRLLAMEQAGEILGFFIQERFSLCVHGQFVCDHVVDFWVRTKPPQKERIDGNYCIIPPNPYFGMEVHEVKGFRTDVWELKYKLFQAIYPEIPYIIINQEEKDARGRSGQGKHGSTRTSKKGIRSESGMRCNHGEGLKRKGVCVICSGLKR